LTNKRDDEYGQDYALFGSRVIGAVKSVMPEDMPLVIRISAVEYAEGGYGLGHGIKLAKRYKEAGVDMIDVSAGGEGAPSKERFQSPYRGYMVPYASRIKEETGIPVIAVGLLEDVNVAEHVVASGDADLTAIGRGLLRDPYWAMNANRKQNPTDRSFIPEQYDRGIRKIEWGDYAQHQLNSSHLYYEMSAAIAPALEIDAGDTVHIHTVDCFENQITSSPDMDFGTVDWSRQNPATGPVFVRGLSAGDVLKVTIEKVELDGSGLATVGPQGGVMKDYIEERHVKFFDLDTENNTTVFNGMTVPLTPMIGVIGN